MSGIPGLNDVNTKHEVKTPYVNADENQVNVDDFLQLMVAQLKNQDFTNPVDDTQYVTQLAQFATMQQMQEMSHYSKTNYAMSLVGKNVTVASLSMGGSVNKVSGPVEKIALSDKDFSIYVKGKPYQLNQIMTIDQPDIEASSAIAAASDMPIILTSSSATQAFVRWEAPTEDKEVANQLKYQVYYSTDATFDKLADVKAGTLAGTVSEKGALNMEVAGLEQGTTYYVNVVVTAPDGTQNTYKKLTVTTDG